MLTYTEPLLTLTLGLSWLGIFFLPRSRARRWLILALLSATLICWPPADYLLSRPLEGGYRVAPFAMPAGVGAVVVLSSGVAPAQYDRPYTQPDPETFARCQHGAWIYRNSPLPVLVSGGNAGVRQPALAETMRQLLESFGVPAAVIWVEDRSRSTHENAAYSARILREHGARRIALVVDARSMPRAAACFRKEGIEVVPAPSRFTSLSSTLEDWILSWKAVRGNEETLHEAGGLLWYRLRGWI